MDLHSGSIGNHIEVNFKENIIEDFSPMVFSAKSQASIEDNPTLHQARSDVENWPMFWDAMKKEIQKNSEFVGDDFVKEVRSMIIDKSKDRSIYGNGTKKEIEELKEEGINILNIPWVPDDH